MINYSAIMLYMLALLVILVMVSLISGILISAAKILIPFIVMLGGFWLVLWAEQRMKAPRKEKE